MGEFVIDDHREAQRQREREWDDRALANPRAVDLMVELLNEMANPTPPPGRPVTPEQKSPTAQAPVLAEPDHNADDDG